jgi:hypothetical protein
MARGISKLCGMELELGGRDGVGEGGEMVYGLGFGISTLN